MPVMTKLTRSNAKPIKAELDAERVEQIVNIVGGDDFGQIFITDTNRDHLDHILATTSLDYKLYNVNNGEVCLSATSNH